MGIETYIVDSFTDEIFKGNPAGVCLLSEDLDDRLMQSIAVELGLSETAFVVQLSVDNTYSIRYFSPVQEIPLCGHATLASAKVIFDIFPRIEQVQFITVEDISLLATKNGEWIQMKFPKYNTISAEVPPQLLDALGISEVENVAYNKESHILLLEIENCQDLRDLRPDFSALVRSHDNINGVLVTAPSQSMDYDFESRYFWPWSGTEEDPVTGSTHAFLAPYWADRLGKTTLNAFQCSDRTGFLQVKILDEEYVIIRGKAKTVLEGNLMV